MPELIIISALAESNRVIGYHGKVPWHLPADSKRFQQLTWGHPVIMGRKTWQDDIEQRPLIHRHNIVVSRSLKYLEIAPDCPESYTVALADSLTTAIALASEPLPTTDSSQIFVVGGAGLYDAALPLADTLELTLVEGDYAGDTFFPAYEALIGTEFELTHCQDHPGFRYVTYRRISTGL